MYKGYTVRCTTPINNNSYNPCNNGIDLPTAAPVDSEDDSPQSGWPTPSWEANLACSKCGHIRLYRSNDIRTTNLTKYRPELYLLVRMSCFKCRIPVGFYVPDLWRLAVERKMPLIDDLKSRAFCDFELDVEFTSWAKTRDWIEVIRSGYFLGRCKSDHDLIPLPKERYRISLERGPIPTNNYLLFTGGIDRLNRGAIR